MSEQNVQELQKALDLIKAGKASKARPILVRLLRENEDLEQAWFLLSYTLPEQEKQEEALVKALQINPAFDKASERLAKLRGAPIPEESADPQAEMQAAYESAVEADDDDAGETAVSEPKVISPFYEGEAEFIDDGGETDAAPHRRSLRTILIAIVVLVLLTVFVIFGAPIIGSLLPSGGDGGPPVLVTETPTPGMRQLPPTWTPTPQEGAVGTPQPEAFLLP